MTNLFNTKINIRTCTYSMSIFSILFISGCNDNSVSTVKESINYSINDTLTIGKALESRTDCINGKWNSSKDNRDRIIVTYECELPQHYLDVYMSIREQNDLKSLNANILVNNNEIKEAHKMLSQWEQEKRILDELFKPFLNNHSGELEQLSKFSTLQHLGNLYLTFESGWSERKLSQDDFCSDYKNSLPDVKEQCTEWYSVYDIKYSLLSSFIELSNSSSIDKKASSFAETDLSNILNNTRSHGNGLLDINNYIQNKSNDITKNINDVTNYINGKDKNIDRDKDALTKVKDNAQIDKVSENFSWYVLDNGSIQELDGGFMVTHNGEDIQVPMNELFDRFLSFAYHDFSDNGIPNAYVDIINNALNLNR
ncbi:hypothetical protein [Lelliottia wanjuensis]|uniref:hypothetical protein n=1 Tax=Lelliottia wanjuensis TaxID=3050585 RepID=UPI00254E4BAA|nr:hypothetical protein [Lelliottia sp. V86_10]MDK9585733.1 hypothetical protein [Lelliottia sp. V86_10]